MTTKAVRYTQPLLGAVPGTDVLVQVDEVAEVLIHQDGEPCTVYGSNDKAALSNPVPRGVLPGNPGFSTRGELLVYFEAGRGYDAVVTVGAGSEAVVTVVPLPDISPDVADAGGTVAAALAALEAALPDTYVQVPGGTPTVGQMLVVASVGPPVVLAWADGGTPAVTYAVLTESGDTLITEAGNTLVLEAA